MGGAVCHTHLLAELGIEPQCFDFGTDRLLFDQILSDLNQEVFANFANIRQLI